MIIVNQIPPSRLAAIHVQHHQTTLQQNRKKRVLPAFPLQARHFADKSSLLSMTPSNFHMTLCDLIRHAKHRVLLASLYVGPAASPSTQREEIELLEALHEVSTTNGGDTPVDVRVVLDEN